MCQKLAKQFFKFKLHLKIVNHVFMRDSRSPASHYEVFKANIKTRRVFQLYFTELTFDVTLT